MEKTFVGTHSYSGNHCLLFAQDWLSPVQLTLYLEAIFTFLSNSQFMIPFPRLGLHF